MVTLGSRVVLVSGKKQDVTVQSRYSVLAGLFKGKRVHMKKDGNDSKQEEHEAQNSIPAQNTN